MCWDDPALYEACCNWTEISAGALPSDTECWGKDPVSGFMCPPRFSMFSLVGLVDLV